MLSRNLEQTLHAPFRWPASVGMNTQPSSISSSVWPMTATQPLCFGPAESISTSSGKI